MRPGASDSAEGPLRRDWVCWVVALGTLAFYVRLLYTSGVSYADYAIYLDEGYRLYPSLRMLRGETLYRDIYGAYTPFSYYLHEIAFALLGVKVSSVRIVLITSQLATTVLTYALARRIMNRWFSCFAGLLTIVYGVQNLNMGFSGWYVLPLWLSAALFLVRWIESGEGRRLDLLGAGVFSGLAIGMKLSNGAWLAIAGALTILFVYIQRDFEPGRGRPRPFNPLYAAHLLLPAVVLLMIGDGLTLGRALLFLLPNLAVSLAILARQLFGTVAIRPRTLSLTADLAIYGAGIVAINVPWIAYYIVKIGPESLRWSIVDLPMALKEQLEVWAVSYPVGLATRLAFAAAAVAAFAVLGPARLRRGATGLLGVSALAVPFVAWKWPLLGHPLLASFPVAVYPALPLASAVALLYAGSRWRHLDQTSHKIALLGIFNGCMTMTLYPWTAISHWFWGTTPALLLGAFAASRLHRALASHVLPLRMSVVAAQCLLLAVWSPSLVAAARGTVPIAWLEGSPTGDVPMSPSSAKQTQQVVDFVNENVPEDGYILEIPTSLYAFLTGRRQAARLDYFYFINSALWDEHRELEAIRRNDPTYALIRSGPFGQWPHGFPGLSEYVLENYKPYKQFGPVTVLRKRPPTQGGPGRQSGNHE